MTAIHAYRIAHRRVTALRGRADGYRCSHCDSRAEHWALIHTAADVLVDSRGQVYSDNPAQYISLCARCHRDFDQAADWAEIKAALGITRKPRRGRPEPTGITPHRTIRVSDQLWQQAAAAAKDNGESVTAVIRRALESYVRRHRKGQS